MPLGCLNKEQLPNTATKSFEQAPPQCQRLESVPKIASAARHGRVVPSIPRQ